MTQTSTDKSTEIIQCIPGFSQLLHIYRQGNYRFFEESWHYTCNLHYNEVLQKHKIGFPLVHSEASFLHPLKYGDTVFCKINVSNIGNSSITWSYELSNQDGKICWSAIQTTVCTNMNSITEKTNVPDWIREGLEKIMI